VLYEGDQQGVLLVIFEQDRKNVMCIEHSLSNRHLIDNAFVSINEVVVFDRQLY
jgi:hypothetical protein